MLTLLIIAVVALDTVLQEIYDRMAPEDKELLEAIHAGKSDDEITTLLETQRQK